MSVGTTLTFNFPLFMQMINPAAYIHSGWRRDVLLRD